jgi:hypothetical protein
MTDTASSMIDWATINDSLPSDDANKLHEETESFIDEIRSTVTASTAITTTNADLRESIDICKEIVS